MARIFNILIIASALFSAVVAGNLREEVKSQGLSYGTPGGWSPVPLDDPYVLTIVKCLS